MTLKNCVISLGLVLLISSIEFLIFAPASSSLANETLKIDQPDQVAVRRSTRQAITQQHNHINETISSNLSAVGRVNGELRRISPLRRLLSKPRVSPLYLINGTVCRFVNYQPVCTTLSTTGLAVGGAGGSGRPAGGSSGGGSRPSGGGSSGGGSSGGGSRPSGGGSSGGGGGSGGGSSGGGGGSRPSSSGVVGGGSSVQFANAPARVSTLIQDDQPEVYAERLESSNEVRDGPEHEQPTSNVPTGSVGVIINRRPLAGLFRRPVQYQLATNRQEDIGRESPPAKNSKDKKGS